MADNAASSTFPLLSPLLVPLLLLLLASLSWRWLTRPPKKLPPSPPSLPIIGHLHLLAKTPLHRALAAISTAVGPVAFLRLGFRSVLLVSSAAAAEECFTDHDLVFATRPRLLAAQILGYGRTTIGWAPHGHHWRNLRRIAAVQLFSSAALLASAATRFLAVRSLAKALFLEFDAAEPGASLRVEMKSRFFDLAYEVMMGVVASAAEGEDVEERRRFRKLVEASFAASGVTSVGDFFPALRWIGWRGPERKMTSIFQRRDALVGEMIDRHRRWRSSGGGEKGTAAAGEREVGKTALIDVMLSLQDTDPEYYTDYIIKGAVVVSFVVV